MSQKVREWLRELDLYHRTIPQDRQDIDREIERRTRTNCDYALENNLISKSEFKEIVALILARKKKKKKELVPMIA